MTNINARRIAVLILLASLAVLSGSCSRRTGDSVDKSERMRMIEKHTFWGIVEDRETGVQYLFRGENGFTVLRNPDGTPYTGG